MTPYYEDNAVKIIHGDALDVLDGVSPGRFSCIVTDPPYTAAGSSSNGRSAQYDDQFFAYWIKAIGERLRNAVRPTGAGFLFCDWRTIHLVRLGLRNPISHQRGKIWDATQALVWDRDSIGMGVPFRNSYEMIAFAKGPNWDASHLPKNLPTVVRYRWPYGNRGDYASEKPAGLIRQLLEWIGPVAREGPVLDPFAGSGPVAEACRALGLSCVLINKIERDCEIAAQRLMNCNPLPFPEPEATPEQSKINFPEVA